MGLTPTLPLQLLAALVAGGFTTLTASPFELWWLGPVAIGLLFLGLHQLSPGQAALKGWLYGVALFASGTSWVYVSIHDYGYTGMPLAVLLTALFVTVLALFFAGTFWLYRRFIGPRWAVITFAGAWVLGEVLRTYLFTGFPWLLVGSSYVDSPLASWAPVGGVYWLSLLVVLSGTLGVAFLRRQWWAALPLAAIWLTPLALPQHWTTPVDEPTRVALLQGNLPQLLKWTPEGQRSAANIYSDLTRQVADDADLILWPETALPMIDSQARPVLERVQSNLPPETALLTGIVQLDEANRYFNSVIGIGNVEGSYQKEHRYRSVSTCRWKACCAGRSTSSTCPCPALARGPPIRCPCRPPGSPSATRSATKSSTRNWWQTAPWIAMSSSRSPTTPGSAPPSARTNTCKWRACVRWKMAATWCVPPATALPPSSTPAAGSSIVHRSSKPPT